jgi:asparagine synthase (glutamine-hydrolysing)
MCGINGILAYNHSASLPARSELLATRDNMTARGPDGSDEWWSADRRLGLGHRRLAIIDLSDRASQPMSSACGRYVVVFNGEIYNYPALRTNLEAQGVTFMTTSDTEVLLHLYAQKRDAMVRDLRGMFAFAIWDEEEHSLFLARDPYGIKPLYTANDGWTFRFASQVKALLAGGKLSRAPEPAGLVGFLLMGSVPEPFTLYRDIRQLPAGHTQYVDATGPREPKPFWSLAETLAQGALHPLPRDEVQGAVTAALQDSVRAHLLADVEVGLFLSRGIDSVALLGLVTDAGHHKTRTITLSFAEHLGTGQDEGPVARTMAQVYGAEHIERTFGQPDFHADLPAILAAMDQPTIDGINMWFIAKAAREAGLKVALSGIGGDELFAGYSSFADIPHAVRAISLPSAIPGAGKVWRQALQLFNIASSRPKFRGLLEFGGSYPGGYLLRRGLFLPFELEDVLDRDLVHAGLDRLQILDRLRETIVPDPGSPVARVTALESVNYMRNQLLRDADWAGMAHGVEIRTPFIDSELLRATAPILPHVRHADKKSLLANATSTPLSADVTRPKKLGFVVPIAHWTSEPGEGSETRMGLSSRKWASSTLSHFDVCLTAENHQNPAARAHTAADHSQSDRLKEGVPA